MTDSPPGPTRPPAKLTKAQRRRRRLRRLARRQTVTQTLADSLRAFVQGPFPQIAGWCSPYIFQTLHPIAEFQRSIGFTAPVCEIGVFQGKFFTALMKTSGLSAGHYAIDVFDMQEFNLDYAGAGNRAAFLKNVALAGEDPDLVTCIERDSTTFRQGELTRIRETVGGFSIFSVDGCHMVQHTINDMQVAMELTADKGVIFVDDYYNPSWPGVHEAVCKMYLTGNPVYVPFCYNQNKLALCHIGYHARYLDYLTRFVATHFPDTETKKVSMFGYDVLAMIPHGRSDKVVA
jgi:hypothetical protein